ncbi:hypothetical protein KAU33_09285 [Candidatus Dependentiae bacterium]|nr:hypothetical protein [Candidatus Dependentiae bacterium]
MESNEKKVRCKFCGELTLSTNTQLCDNCWEFERRIEQFISNRKGMCFVVRKIKEAKIKKWQDKWYKEIDERWVQHEIDSILIPTEVIDSIKCNTNFEDWIRKMKNLYISNPLCSEIIMDAVSNSFLWLDVEQ